MDACQLWLQIRAGLGEMVETHWSDLELLGKMNFEYKRLWMQLALQAGDWLVTSESVTVTDSVITLPARCGKPVYLENGEGYSVPLSLTVREKNLSSLTRTTFENNLYAGYLLGNTIVLNATGLSGTWTLWYQQRFIDLAFGVAGASSGAAALHFEGAQQPKMANDYYNSVGVNTYDSSTYAPKLDDTITDYVGATLVATITGTPTAGDLYGTEHSLPEEAEALLVARTVMNCLAKPSAAIDPKYFEYHAGVVRFLEKSWQDWISTRLPGGGQVRVSRISHG